MEWLYNMLISAGVNASASSWCVVGVVLLCVYTVFHALVKLVDL